MLGSPTKMASSLRRIFCSNESRLECHRHCHPRPARRLTTCLVPCTCPWRQRSTMTGVKCVTLNGKRMAKYMEKYMEKVDVPMDNNGHLCENQISRAKELLCSQSDSRGANWSDWRMQELVEENCFQEVKAVNILTAPLSCNILEPKPCRMLCSTDPNEGQDLPPMLWPQFIFITFYYFFFEGLYPFH